VGLGLSAGAMVFAAAGYVPPAIGALLQEGIDVAVILNALRTSASGPLRPSGKQSRARRGSVVFPTPLRALSRQ